MTVGFSCPDSTDRIICGTQTENGGTMLARTGTLYLIPTPLGNIDPGPTLSPRVSEVVKATRIFVVERPKTATKFLGRMGVELDDCVFVPTARLTDEATIAELLRDLETGNDVGVLSEAGCPGVADPGSLITRAAHEQGAPVVPLVGPSSVILALMASGMNGQNFHFHGYLPLDRAKRADAVRKLDRTARERGETQVFIEAPHRNDHLLTDLISNCSGSTLLCVALDLTLPGEYIRTKTISSWKSDTITLGKRPAIFLLGR